MKRLVILAFAALFAVHCHAQKVYRAPIVTIAENTTTAATFIYSNYAEMGDAAVEMIWFEIIASTNVALYTVSSGGAYTNTLFSADLTTATTTNAFCDFGVWPASDFLLFTVAYTNAAATFRPILKVTK